MAAIVDHGVDPTVDVEALLESPVAELMARAAARRDAAHGARVTFSPKVFIPLTMLCRDKCGYCTFAKPPAHLVFAYGVAHPVLPPVSGEQAALMREVPALLQFPPEATSFFNQNYLGGPLSTADGYAFPVLADLRGLCPTLVLNAEYDDLRPSGQAFAAALAAAGVDVRQVMVVSMLHGFLNLPASIGPVGEALDLIAATLRLAAAQLIHHAPHPPGSWREMLCAVRTA